MGQAVSHPENRAFETVHVVSFPPPPGYHQATTNREEKLKMKNTSTLNKVLLTAMGILGVTALILLSISTFNKWFFYIYFPAHMLILALIKWFVL